MISFRYSRLSFSVLRVRRALKNTWSGIKILNCFLLVLDFNETFVKVKCHYSASICILHFRMNIFFADVRRRTRVERLLLVFPFRRSIKKKKKEIVLDWGNVKHYGAEGVRREEGGEVSAV